MGKQVSPRRANSGTKILLDRKPYIVIGVMPREFEFSAGPRATEPRGVLGADELHRRGTGACSRGKLELRDGGAAEPGVSVKQAESDAGIVAQEIMRNYRR